MTKPSSTHPLLPFPPFPEDGYGRTVNYLRMSVTDRCNLRCLYCNGGKPAHFIPHNNILTYEEMLSLIRLASSMGVSKVRLTGGEPLVRKNFIWFVSKIVEENPEIDLRITTNGTLLAGKVKALKEAGIQCINLSIDSFIPEKFQTVTGRDMLRQVTDAIDEVLHHDMKLKLNAVALKGFNDDELATFINFASQNPVDVRFIEFMPMGDCTRWTQKNFWPSHEILAATRKMVSLIPVAKTERKAGPAKLYAIAGGCGRIGVISPLTNHFCKSCNRLRVTPDGRLRTCLFSDKEYDLRSVLRHPKLSLKHVASILRTAHQSKPLGHLLLSGKTSKAVAHKQMSAIGG